ncbi:MAG: hypothetical protein ABIY63_18130 [Fibrobacteria bacterium]
MNNFLTLLFLYVAAKAAPPDPRLIPIAMSPCEAGEQATSLYRFKAADPLSGSEYYIRECFSGGNSNQVNWNFIKVSKDLRLTVILDATMQQPRILSSGKNGLPDIENITCIRNGTDAAGETRIKCDTNHFQFNGKIYPGVDKQVPGELNMDSTAFLFLVQNAKKPLPLKNAHTLALKYRASGKGNAAAEIALAYSHDIPGKWTVEETKFFNDFGFFLNEECFLKEADKLLRSVLAHDSSRTSALLNLADNLRYSNEMDSAKVIYAKYLDAFGKSKSKGKPAWWALFLTGKADNPQKKKVPSPGNCAI